MFTLIAKRYAHAFYDFADGLLKVDVVQSDLKVLSQFLKISGEFSKLIDNPNISADQRIAVLRETFKGKISQHTFIFLLFLEEKKRLELLPVICNEFENFVFESQNTVKARITSSIPLADKQVETICAQLKKRLSKDVVADVETDKSLLGGFKIQLVDSIIDNSLRYQLDKFKKELIRA